MTVRALTLLSRRAGTTVEQFTQYWRTHHAQVAVRLPHLRHYAQHLVVDTRERGDVPAPASTVDGISELVFDTREQFEEALSGAVAQEAADDARVFVEQMRMYVVETTVVVLDGQVSLPTGTTDG